MWLSVHNSLPPAQRKRRISADLGNCQTNIEKKEKEVGGVNMLYENYTQFWKKISFGP